MKFWGIPASSKTHRMPPLCATATVQLRSYGIRRADARNREKPE